MASPSSVKICIYTLTVEPRPSRNACKQDETARAGDASPQAPRDAFRCLVERPLSGDEFGDANVADGSCPAARPAAPTGRYAAHSGRTHYDDPMSVWSLAPKAQFGHDLTFANVS